MLGGSAAIRTGGPVSRIQVNNLSGTGPFTKLGSGLLVLRGSAANTCIGDTLATEGTMRLAKSGVSVIPGALTIGTRTVFNEGGTSATVTHFASDVVAGTNVTVNGRSLYDLNGLRRASGTPTRAAAEATAVASGHFGRLGLREQIARLPAHRQPARSGHGRFRHCAGRC